MSTGIEIVNIRAKVIAAAKALTLPLNCSKGEHDKFEPIKVYGSEEPAKVFNRDQLKTGTEFEGPAVVSEYAATIFVAPGWTARVDQYGNLLLSKKTIE